jgi:Domain of unknown function (DUF4129)
MNTRIVDPRTIWAILAMEAGLVLPIISLPTQGDRIPGVLGPLLLLLLLPLGFVGVHQIRELRDPSWRLLSGIGAALLPRLIVSYVPEPGLPGLAVWLGHSFVPAAIGVGLWWRGGALCVAEVTAAEVRTEFSILALCMLGLLALVRPFLLPDPVLLGGSVALFVAGGLIATALSRQDAAEAASAGSGRALAATTALMPIGLAVILVGILRPTLLGVMWTTLARIVELVLTPVGWFFAWLASLLPRGGPPGALPPIIRPTPEPLPNTAALNELQGRMEWIGWVVIITLLIAATVAALIVARILLSNWIGSPTRPTPDPNVELTVERSGTARDDAHHLWGWLMRWLRSRLGRRAAPAGLRHGGAEASAVDAWAAYRGLLEWAERRGQGRRPAETTGQLRSRLATQAPETSEAVDLVTSTYEWERYGQVVPVADRLRRVRQALASLLAR